MMQHAGKNDSVVSIRDLFIHFPLRYGTVNAVRNVDMDIPRGKVTALVGESGSGKSTLASALLNLVSYPGEITQGEILFEGTDVLKMDAAALHNYRWEEIAMVFQAAQSALNPVMNIKDIITETYLAHRPGASEAEILARASELLEYVRLEPKRVLAAFPHELSGGMKQRVMIAFSMLLSPKLLILDEPTTALDVITQEYIFEILLRLHQQSNITMLLLTHDISVVAKVADRVAVMYAGKIVEEGDIFKVFKQHRHPYTEQLLASVPSLAQEVPEVIESATATLDLFNLPKGCAFIGRCPYGKAVCESVDPSAQMLSEDHRVYCHRYNNAQYQLEPYKDAQRAAEAQEKEV